MSAVAYVNGRIVAEQDAMISVFDHGFLYREGVYEVIRTYGGELFLVDRHFRRLRASASMITLEVGMSDGALEGIVRETVAAYRAGAGGAPGDREVLARILLTRGIGEMSYDPSKSPHPSLVVIVEPLVPPQASAYDRGVAVSLVSVVRNHPASVDPRIKSNNLLNNVLAMQEALRRGPFFEAIMRNVRGELAECSQSNLFLVKDGTVRTPALDAGLLAGITREFVEEVAVEAGIPVVDGALHDEDLFGADEAFLTSTSKRDRPDCPCRRPRDRQRRTGTRHRAPARRVPGQGPGRDRAGLDGPAAGGETPAVGPRARGDRHTDHGGREDRHHGQVPHQPHRRGRRDHDIERDHHAARRRQSARPHARMTLASKAGERSGASTAIASRRSRSIASSSVHRYLARSAVRAAGVWHGGGPTSRCSRAHRASARSHPRWRRASGPTLGRLEHLGQLAHARPYSLVAPLVLQLAQRIAIVRWRRRQRLVAHVGRSIAGARLDVERLVEGDAVIQDRTSPRPGTSAAHDGRAASRLGRHPRPPARTAGQGWTRPGETPGHDTCARSRRTPRRRPTRRTAR